MKTLAFAAILLVGARPAWSTAVLGAIFGDDGRKDVYEAAGDPDLKALARGTAALFCSDDVRIQGETAFLNAPPLNQSYRFADGEKFTDQPAGAGCSGGLVAPDLVLTAGHCVETLDICRDIKFVFDYAVTEKGHDATKIPSSSVFGCKKLIKSLQDYTLEGTIDLFGQTVFALPSMSDWALVQLDRPVMDRAPLRVAAADGDEDSEVFAIGYPLGLPAKIALGGKIRPEIAGFGRFNTDLDIYRGDSGGPVFDAKTKLVIGIVTSLFPPDLVIAPGMKLRSNVIPSGEEGGAFATRVTSFIDDLQPLLSQYPASALDGSAQSNKAWTRLTQDIQRLNAPSSR